MSRPASDRTLLLQCRSMLRRMTAERDEQKAKATNWQRRAEAAEHELQAWKLRFDAMLKIVPVNKP